MIRHSPSKRVLTIFLAGAAAAATLAALISAVVPPEFQARDAALQIVLIGVLICIMLLLRPRGFLGERRTVSRHVTESANKG